LSEFQPSSEFALLLDEIIYATKIPSLSKKFAYLNCSIASRLIAATDNLEIQRMIDVSLLQSKFFCYLSNPNTLPSIGEVDRLLQ